MPTQPQLTPRYLPQKGKSRAATEFAVSGQDDDAVLHFMRDIHRSEPIVGRGTRGAGTASVDVPSLRNRGRPAAPRPPRVAKAAAGVLLPATSAVQAAQIARLPNMFPFNQGETTAGLCVGCYPFNFLWHVGMLTRWLRIIAGMWHQTKIQRPSTSWRQRYRSVRGALSAGPTC